ncbi:hypothetical protein, partial [Rhodobacter capsulatus]|uniref:hypothetical protein n=1 Tax=Rhodobacter capsulatus TaxID=1061 RepID=UPI001F2B1A01
REFKRKLGDSQKEALAAYPQYHAQVEREIEAEEKDRRGRGRVGAGCVRARSLCRGCGVGLIWWRVARRRRP